MAGDSASISTPLDLMARLSAACPSLWTALGDLESSLLEPRLAPVVSPVHICGLARSGSTLLLEILAAHPDVATHRYRDFPFLMTPWLWNAAVSLNPLRRSDPPRERPHGDGMRVTPDSPEALEEMLWMAFFPHCHDETRTHVMEASQTHPAFEHFYRRHIQKLLLVSGGKRYAAKGNYNITRMAYLAAHFPDARFLLPVREPVSHVASLMRQHARFSALGREDARVVRHMDMAGHFEFGLNRRIIHTGDAPRMAQIRQAWQEGDEARGWALYWDMIHRFAHRQMETLEDRLLVVRLEDMRRQPEEGIRRLLAHCRLEENAAIIERFCAGMRHTDHSDALTTQQQDDIRRLTAQTAGLFGYG